MSQTFVPDDLLIYYGMVHELGTLHMKNGRKRREHVNNSTACTAAAGKTHDKLKQSILIKSQHFEQLLYITAKMIVINLRVCQNGS